MIIDYQKKPIVGKAFSITFDDFKGTANVFFFIESELYSKVSCPDPPCHEILQIPEGSEGKTLRVVATDIIEKKVKEFVIHGSEGRTMATGNAI